MDSQFWFAIGVIVVWSATHIASIGMFVAECRKGFLKTGGKQRPFLIASMVTTIVPVFTLCLLLLGTYWFPSLRSTFAQFAQPGGVLRILNRINLVVAAISLLFPWPIERLVLIKGLNLLATIICGVAEEA